MADRDHDARRQEHLWSDQELEQEVDRQMAKPAAQELVAQIERHGYSHENAVERVRFQARTLIRSNWVQARGQELLDENNEA